MSDQILQNDVEGLEAEFAEYNASTWLCIKIPETAHCHGPDPQSPDFRLYYHGEHERQTIADAFREAVAPGLLEAARAFRGRHYANCASALENDLRKCDCPQGALREALKAADPEDLSEPDHGDQDCVCYFTCGKDSHSSVHFHQHEDEPCRVHPDAPMVG